MYWVTVENKPVRGLPEYQEKQRTCETCEREFCIKSESLFSLLNFTKVTLEFSMIFQIRLKIFNFRVICPLRFLCIGTELVMKVLYVFYVNYVLSQV